MITQVPPLFLDVHPDHFVLDSEYFSSIRHYLRQIHDLTHSLVVSTVCAAPGSKTFQLLEIIHESAEPGSLPNGMVCNAHFFGNG